MYFFPGNNDSLAWLCGNTIQDVAEYSTEQTILQLESATECLTRDTLVKQHLIRMYSICAIQYDQMEEMQVDLFYFHSH